GVGKDIAMAFDETSEDIPSLFITPEFLEENLPDGLTAPVPQGAILPETESQDDYVLALNGLVVSNFATFLGLPDMFNAHTQRSAVGMFDLMDVGLFNGQGLLPSIPMAWHRIQNGWDSAETVTAANDSLLQIGSYKQNELNIIYKFPITSSEYFLLEMRAPGELFIDSLRYEEATNEYYPNVKEILLGHYSNLVQFSERGVLTDVDNLDMGIPGNGILIWHVDENVINARLENNEPINNDQDHQGIDLEEADGSQDIGEQYEALTSGSGSENGWLLDMYYEENNAPMYETNNESFSPHTIPASTSNYMNGNSHLTLHSFSKADTVMSFKADFDLFEPGYPIELPFNGKVQTLKAFPVFSPDNNNDIVIGSDNNVYILDDENPTKIDSVTLKDSLLTILKLEKRNQSFLTVTQSTASINTYEDEEINTAAFDSLADDEKYTSAVLLPDSEFDYLFLGTNTGNIKIFTINASSISTHFSFKLINEEIVGFFPFKYENEIFAVFLSASNNIIFSLQDNSQIEMPNITVSYGSIIDGWIIEDIDSSNPILYFLTDEGNLVCYDFAYNNLAHLKNIQTTPKPPFPYNMRNFSCEPTYLLPVQWNNYGEWITSLAILGNDLQIANLSGAPLVNFPRNLINQNMAGKFVSGYPVLTEGLSSAPEITYFPALVKVEDELENSSAVSNGMLLTLFGRDGKIKNESYLPISGNYTASVIYSDNIPNSSLLAVTDSSGNKQKLSLFRLPYSTVYDNGYNNLANYNWKYFK
ncbi:MAG: hypothetical protein KAR38_04665, partial [Calditrichia bacterium]|nr:hypothetical protein [Calditrichia bacterium]